MLRRLNPSKPDDYVLFELAWQWLEAMPRWFKAEPCYASFYDRRATVEQVFSGEYAGVMVFDEGEPVSLISYTVVEPEIVETAIISKRGVNPAIVADAGRELNRQMLDRLGIAEIRAWISRRNRPIRAVLQQLGFESANIEDGRGQLWVLNNG